MTQLWAWEYEGKTEFGYKIISGFEDTRINLRVRSLPSGWIRHEQFITNLRRVKVVDEDAYEPTPPITKTYLTIDQFIKVWKSLDDDKIKHLSEARSEAWDEAWYAAWTAAWSEAWDADWSEARSEAWCAVRYADWYAARSVDLAILVKHKITAEEFEILTQPWTSCGLSLYAEDWEEVLNPKVEEPKNFGAVVGAKLNVHWTPRRLIRSPFKCDTGLWYDEDGNDYVWSDLINPTIISEGVEG